MIDARDMISSLEEIKATFIRLAREKSGPKPTQGTWAAFKISETCENAAKQLKRNIPQKMDVEGDRGNWWYVCPECHGAIDRGDLFCRHCGQEVEE